MYRMLEPDKIIATAAQLERRVRERFPASGLSEIATEFVALAHNVSAVASYVAAPHRAMRFMVGGALFLLGAVSLVAVAVIDLRTEAFSTLSDFAQGLEALISDMVFIGVAVFFLLSAEARIKRKRALAVIRELRAIAHIIDMHQLTKDPERFEGRGPDTASSPERDLTAFELTRYLDYSSELLALISKLAALLIQGFDDAITLSAVNEIEDLTAGMSRKIWQKITIVDRFVPVAAERARGD